MSIPISDVKIIDIKPLLERPPSQEFLDRSAARQERLAAQFEKLQQRTDPDLIRENLLRSRNSEVHTVFRVGGEIVGSITEGNGGAFSSNADGGFMMAAKREGEAAGLTGRILTDFVSQEVGDRMARKYGSSLQVERFTPGTGPTKQEVNEERTGQPMRPIEESVQGFMDSMQMSNELFARMFENPSSE